jgi:hypothetical protein
MVDSLFSGPGFEPHVPQPGDERSAYLGNNILYSEFWPEDLDRETAEAELEQLPIRIGATMGRLLERERWTWPFYDTPDELMRWAETSTPVLLLNGDIDAQTHIDGLADVEASFDEPWQQLVELPLAAHGTVFWSGPGTKNPRATCGMELVEDFFADPRSTVDTTCATVTPDVDFEDAAGLSGSVFGTADLWENGQGIAFSAAPDARLLKAIDAVRASIRQAPTF